MYHFVGQLVISQFIRAFLFFKNHIIQLPCYKDDLKNKDDLNTEDNLKNEDDKKNKSNLNNEYSFKNEDLILETIPGPWLIRSLLFAFRL